MRRFRWWLPAPPCAGEESVQGQATVRRVGGQKVVIENVAAMKNGAVVEDHPIEARWNRAHMGEPRATKVHVAGLKTIARSKFYGPQRTAVVN